MAKDEILAAEQTSGPVIPEYLSELARRWPYPFVRRAQVSEFTNGLYAPKYVAALDQRGQGPRRVSMGKRGSRVFYPVKDFIAWMASRIAIDEPGCLPQTLNEVVSGRVPETVCPTVDQTVVATVP